MRFLVLAGSHPTASPASMLADAFRFQCNIMTKHSFGSTAPSFDLHNLQRELLCERFLAVPEESSNRIVAA